VSTRCLFREAHAQKWSYFILKQREDSTLEDNYLNEPGGGDKNTHNFEQVLHNLLKVEFQLLIFLQYYLE